MKRRRFLSGVAALTSLAALPAHAVPKPDELVVFKSPYCGCCGSWITHMKSAGFAVRVVEVKDAGAERSRLGMPDRFASCHTATIGGYVLEGHVPAAEVKRLLATRPKALGLAVPGMPQSAPGMDVPGRKDPFQVLLVDAAGQSSTFGTYPK